MTLLEAVLVFDSIVQLDPKFHDLSAQNTDVGVPYCCGLPVVQESQDGRVKLYCVECERTIYKLGRQWIVQCWGAKGIKLPPPNRDAQEIFDAFRAG